MRLWKLDESARIDDTLEWCIERRSVDRVLMTTRIDTDRRKRVLLEPKVDDTVKRVFGDALLRTPWVTAWPVIELIRHPGKAYIARLDREVVQRMSAVQNRLFGWTESNEPPLPEDPCVYRTGDPLPLLITRTHTRDLWLLHDGEVDLDGAREVAWDPELLEFIPQKPDFVQEEQ